MPEGFHVISSQDIVLTENAMLVGEDLSVMKVEGYNIIFQITNRCG